MDDPPGSGPYYVAERVVNRRIVLKRNLYYRGDRPANVDQVVMTVGASSEACQLAVEQDRLDICFGPPPSATFFRRLADQYGINRPGGQFFRSPMIGTAHLVFNHDSRWFKGPGQIALKKAINFAIDRPELARAFGYLGTTRTDQMVPPALGRDASVYPLQGADPATARKWLARARLKPKTLVYYGANDRFGITIAQTLQFNLQQIGIELDVRYYDFFTRLEKLGIRGEPFDLSYNNFSVDYADAASFFELLLDPNLRATGNSNVYYYSNPRVTARMEAANRLSGDARRQAWADLDAELMRTDPPWAPIAHQAARTFVSRSYGCFVLHPVYLVDLAAACKK
jgi:ABC-type oligopeptide transport system substrate-binding subunit